MRRAALTGILLLLAFAGTQAQVRFNGPGASVNSPGPDGSLHGVPASILSPTPVQNPNARIIFNAPRQRVPFGNPHLHHRRNFVPVPIFIPAYDISDPSISQVDPPVDSEPVVVDSNSALREAYIRGAHDAIARQQADSRYGEHYLDSREKPQANSPAATDKKSEKSASREEDPDPEPPAPAAVFIFKDGHKLETRNFAISGQTLFDFSGSALKKIKLAELDLDATRKANDDLGIDLRLP